jgi:hypothetical protein
LKARATGFVFIAIFLILLAVGVLLGDIDEIFVNGRYLCLSCIGIG